MLRSAAIAILILVLACSGCAVIPVKKKIGSRGAVPEDFEQSLKIGLTTREEVLLSLGEPDFIEDSEQVLTWRWKWGWDTYWFAGGGYGASAGASAGVNRDRKDHSVRIDFDEEGRVTSLTHLWQSGYGEDRPTRPSFRHIHPYGGFELRLPKGWLVLSDDCLFSLLNRDDLSHFPASWNAGRGRALVEAHSSALSLGRRGFCRSESLESPAFLKRPGGNWKSYKEGLSLALFDTRPGIDFRDEHVDILAKYLAPHIPNAKVQPLACSRRSLKCGLTAILTEHTIEMRVPYSQLSLLSLSYWFAHNGALFQIGSYCEIPYQASARKKVLSKHRKQIQKVADSFRIMRK